MNTIGLPVTLYSTFFLKKYTFLINIVKKDYKIRFTYLITYLIIEIKNSHHWPVKINCIKI